MIAASDEIAPKPLVLVVEDDLDTQTYMRAVLSSRYRVVVASSADEARRRLDEAAGAVAIVLLDLSLRGEEDGLSLARALRADGRYRALPIVATTAHAFPEDRRNVLEAGCDDYLAKPIEVSDLLAKVRHYTKVV
jgi:CheY-like chemotaxis protein